MGKKRKKNHARPAGPPDPFALYEASVQDAVSEAKLIRRMYHTKRGQAPRLLREDFCGTALLAAEWTVQDCEARAWGVDLDPAPLDWARAHRLPWIGEAADRLRLVESDARSAATPRVDIVAALNFSYSLFKERDHLLHYMKAARSFLRKDGLFLVDVFGGTESCTVKKDHREVAATELPDGTRMPAFRYTWDQAIFNPITHDMRCHIHFKMQNGQRLKKAFTYDWRLYTIPEIQDLMKDAGYTSTDVYIHNFDEDGDSDEVYRRRTRYENTLGWVAYVAGWC